MIPDGQLAVDASVAIKWYVPEVGSVEAGRLLERDAPLVAPDLIVAEFGNVLWKKVRTGELDAHEAQEIIEAFLLSSPMDLQPASLFLDTAFDIASRWHVTVYDALYLAVAVAGGCPLVSADRKLAQRLQGTALQESVLLLADLEL